MYKTPQSLRALLKLIRNNSIHPDDTTECGVTVGKLAHDHIFHNVTKIKNTKSKTNKHVDDTNVFHVSKQT